MIFATMRVGSSFIDSCSNDDDWKGEGEANDEDDVVDENEDEDDDKDEDKDEDEDENDDGDIAADDIHGNRMFELTRVNDNCVDDDVRTAAAVII